MTALALKILAVLFMLTDHVGAALYRDAALNMRFELASGFLLMRCIGRMAFPMFAFLVAEGCAHTRDARKYIARLGVFALLSELPFDRFSGLLSGANPPVFESQTQNVLFTLMLGAVAARLYAKAWREKREKSDAVLYGAACAAMLPFVIILGGEYSFCGVLAVLLPYVFRPKSDGDADKIVPGSRAAQAAAAVAPVAALALSSGWHWLYFGLFGAGLLIALYNGKPGSRRGKYLFYFFYPAHLLALSAVLGLIVSRVISITS